MPSLVRVFEQRVRITPFVSPWSTTDKITSTTVPLLRVIGGRSVIKSMERFANGCVIVGPGIGLNEGLDKFQLICELLAYTTPFDIVLDEGPHSQPPIICLDSIKGLNFSWMSSG